MGKRLFLEIHFKIKNGMRDTFLKKIKEAGVVGASRKEAGNGRYDYFYPVNNPDELVLLEVWNTKKDQEKHAETKHYQLFSELKQVYVTDMNVKTVIYEHTCQEHYIASCVFTSKYPELSQKIQQYITHRYHMPVVRCCVPNYSFEYFNDQMPDAFRSKWNEMPDCGDYAPGDTVYSLCHNCSAIIEEYKKDVKVKSLWELILADESFDFPDYNGIVVTVQDCWRAKERHKEQEAVRLLLRQMNLKIRELPDKKENTDFCGVSLYRQAPKRNLELAPDRFVINAKDKFVVHTKEEQAELMKNYCKVFQTVNVVDYCHYCHEGLELGGVNAFHIASLLFESEECKRRLIK